MLVLFHFPSLAQEVSFDAPAMPLARLLPALGKACGVELVAAPNVAKDVALVRVKDRPWNEILKRLAEEDGAEVEATKTGYRIVRTPTSERRERQSSLARKIASLQPELDSFRAALTTPANEAAYRTLIPKLKTAREGQPGIVGSIESGERNPMAQTPAARAAIRALLTLPIDLLAELHEGDRVVYSNRPTRLQRSLPALEGVLKSFAQEYDAWSDAATRAEPVKTSDYADDPFRHVTPLGSPPTRAVLIVSRGNSGATAGVRLTILDAKGEGLGTASVQLVSQEVQRSIEALGAKGEPIPLSPETLTLVEGLPSREDPMPIEPSAAALDLVSHPEIHDPLAFGATDLVRDLAGETPVIAVLPDMAAFVGLISRKGAGARERAFFQSRVETRKDDGWLLIQPREPGIARQTRVARDVLGRFLRTVVSTRRAPLDAAADYAWNAADTESDFLGTYFASAITGGLFNADFNWRELRLYGSLSPSDRQTLLSGGQKGWSTLSEAQRRLASKIAETGIHSVRYERGEAAPPPMLAMEPTEIFATGWDTLEIGLQSKQETPLLCDSTVQNVRQGYQRIIEPERVGDYLAMKDGPRFDRFGVVRRTTITLGVSVKRGVGIGADLHDDLSPKEPLRPLSDLPKTIRETVERSIEDAERRNGAG